MVQDGYPTHPVVNVLKGVGVFIVGMIVVSVVLVGLYLGGWWLRGNNTNNQQKIDRLNYGSQLTYINKVQANISDIAGIEVQISSPSTPADEKAALQAQEQAIVTATCSVAHLITTPPADEATWTVAHCS